MTEQIIPHLMPYSSGGVILVDKPRGPSSHQVAAWVREMTGVSQVGHTGTLDPQVSGVLVILLGKAVRLTSILHLDDKEYVALLKLHKKVSSDEFTKVIAEFTGKLYQRPPRKSAVKRALRIREIKKLEVLGTDNEFVLLRVGCDSGTYIRSLCHHLGMALGVGGHMAELRRTMSSGFTEDQIHSLYDLRDAIEQANEGDLSVFHQMVIPIKQVLAGIPTVTIKDTAVDAVCNGAKLSGRGIVSREEFQMEDTVQILTLSGELVCLGEALMSSSRVEPGMNGLVIAPRIVFMDTGTYPKIWKKKREETHNP
jgi:predicted rRNA pseudouridine synthase